jgi:glucose uptake protein GlcU
MALIAQQVSFQKGKAILVNPVFTVASIVLPVITGVAVFDEWALKTGREIIFQVVAIAIIVSGALILSSRQEPGSVSCHRQGKQR